MKKSLKTILGSTALVVLICWLVLGIAHIWLTRPSERELWRITQYDRIDHLTVIGNLLLFEGYKKDDSTECICVYAADKKTGEVKWSTEELAKPYIEKYKKFEADTGRIPGIVYILSSSEANGVIYLMMNFETLFALNAKGEIIWQQDFNGIYPLTLFDTFSDDSVYLIDAQSNLVALDNKTGKEIWKEPITLEKDQYAWLTYHNNILYLTLEFDHYEQHLALDAKTGKKIWETKTRAISSAFAFSDNMIYSSNLDSWDNRTYIYLTAFDIHTGQQTWEVPFQEHTLGTLPTNAIGSQVYVTVDKNRDALYRVARLVVFEETGEILWQFNDDFSHGSIGYLISTDLVYIGTEDGYVFALDRKTGQEIWKIKMPTFPTYFLLEGNTLVVGFEDNYVSALDAKTVTQQWMLNLHANTIYEQNWFDASEVINIHSGILYVSSNKPAIYAVDISSGNVLWSWNHSNLFPRHWGYNLGLLDNDVIYVIGGGGPFDIAGSGLFALKATP